jgi:hypothetical protein|tara:strand:- start:1222 stop:1485 length:264 start_codon:yes stop_codon:yes gene_type:complete
MQPGASNKKTRDRFIRHGKRRGYQYAGAKQSADYSDIELNRNIGVQLDACELSEGTDLADIVKLNRRISAQWTRLGINASLIQLIPF